MDHRYMFERGGALSASVDYSWIDMAWKGRFRRFSVRVIALGTLSRTYLSTVHTTVNPSTSLPLYDPLYAYAGEYEVWNWIVPDLSMTEATEIFASHHRQQFIANRISGFKPAECDGSNYTGGWSFPNCAELPSGLDGEKMHSVMDVSVQLRRRFDSQDPRGKAAVRHGGLGSR